MSQSHPPVSLHPYFEINDGEIEHFKALMDKFVERTSSEPDCLYYDFTLNGRTVLCRETYSSADAVLHHLDNVGDILEQALGISTLIRLELHGPAEEIDKLRSPLAELNPDFFVRVTGLSK